jgi:hypothetical protein
MRELLVEIIVGTIPRPSEYMWLNIVASHVIPHDRLAKCHD